MAQKRNSTAATTLVRVPWSVADELNEIRGFGQSYADVIQRLLNEYKGGK